MIPAFSGFPTYFAILSLTMTLLLFWLNHRMSSPYLKIERAPKFKRKVAFDLAIVIMVSGFLGGRFLHVVYEEWLYYLTYPLEVFKFWKGGFVYYGGWITSFIASIVFLKRRKLAFLPWADFFTPLLSLGYALGRVACYIEGCCYGTTRVPLQLIMVVSELILLGLVLLTEKKSWFQKSGELFSVWLIAHAVTRFILEFYRSDNRGSYFFGTFSISQMISVLLVAFGFAIIFRKQK